LEEGGDHREGEEEGERRQREEEVAEEGVELQACSQI
jgi:hypothetical protein